MVPNAGYPSAAMGLGVGCGLELKTVFWVLLESDQSRFGGAPFQVDVNDAFTSDHAAPYMLVMLACTSPRWNAANQSTGDR